MFESKTDVDMVCVATVGLRMSVNSGLSPVWCFVSFVGFGCRMPDVSCSTGSDIVGVTSSSCASCGVGSGLGDADPVGSCEVDSCSTESADVCLCE